MWVPPQAFWHNWAEMQSEHAGFKSYSSHSDMKPRWRTPDPKESWPTPTHQCHKGGRIQICLLKFFFKIVFLSLRVWVIVWHVLIHSRLACFKTTHGVWVAPCLADTLQPVFWIKLDRSALSGWNWDEIIWRVFKVVDGSSSYQHHLGTC